LGGVEVQLLSFHADTFLRWLVVTLNFSFICAVLTISCNVLLSRLEISLRQLQMSSQTLVQEQSSLKKVNEELRLIFAAVSHLNEVVMIIRVLPDSSDEERLRIVFVNDAFERMTGYSAEDVIGHPSFNHWTTELRSDWQRFAWHGRRCALSTLN
jgi:PAS domain-containing protein